MSITAFIRHHFATYLPTTCVLCRNRSKVPLCLDCTKMMPILSHCCEKCAEILPLNAASCGKCLSNPPPYELTHALFRYEAPVIKLISQLKFQHQLHLAYFFATCLSTKIKEDWYRIKPLPDVIIPVPLHPARLRERGFNQALEIAKPIANALKRPLDLTGLIRIKNTETQSHLNASRRKHNMKNAFKAVGDYSGLTVALLDDVITTGETITACSHALKMNGANSIHVWCCGRRS